MNYTVTDTVLLDIDVERFEYQPGVPVLTNIRQRVFDIHRPDVKQGQVVAILGPSGIGKSTFFELLTGLRTPSKGQIKAYDTAQQALAPVKAGMVGMVYQSYDLFPFLTVRGQLELGARKGGWKGEEAIKKIDFYLKHFDLDEHVRKFPNELSGGQRQRLAIAQQLLCSNSVLLLDEPFSGLDPHIKSSICKLISDISKLDEMMTILIVSHDIEPTMAIADTVWLMGRLPDGSASVVEVIDMMKAGYCWRSDIQTDSKFQQLVQDVSNRFGALGGNVD